MRKLAKMTCLDENIHMLRPRTCLYLLSILFCFAQSLHVSAEKADILDKGLEADMDLGLEEFESTTKKEKNFNDIDYLNEFGKIEKWDEIIRQKEPVYIGEFYDKTPFRAVLPAKSIVRTIDGDVPSMTQKQILVEVIPHSPHDLYADIKMKNGPPRYKTMIRGLQSIERDLDMFPSPKQYETYEPVSRTSDTESFSVEHFLSIHYESIDGTYFSDLFPFEKERIHTQSANFVTYLSADILMDFGVGVTYNNYREFIDNSKLYGEYFAWGPSFKIPILEVSDKLQLFVSASFQYATRFNLHYQGVKYEFNSTEYHFKFGGIYKTWAGNFTGGLVYQQMHPTLDNASKDKPTSTITNSIDVIALSIGYNLSYDL